MVNINYLQESRNRLYKALKHLEYSSKKVALLSDQLPDLNEESLEVWESFTFRFARVTDLFLYQYLRSYILFEDPGFRGTFCDWMNEAQKLNLMDNVDIWMFIRELRNFNAYTDEDFVNFFKALTNETVHLLNLKKMLDYHASCFDKIWVLQ